MRFALAFLNQTASDPWDEIAYLSTSFTCWLASRNYALVSNQFSYLFSAEVEKWGALGPISLMKANGKRRIFLSVVYKIMQFHWQMVA
jgi:hypothetical protein